jgi:hypothetical protein
MKQLDKDQAAFWPSTEQMERLRRELRRGIMREELESTLRLRAVSHLIQALNVDLEGFRRFWVLPLLEAGASLEIALACIAQSRFQPN